jgi:hypothetical protein
MRRLILLSILVPACSQEEAVLQYTVNGPDPAVSVLELETFELRGDLRGSSSSVSGEDPIEFPLVGSIGYFDDDARSEDPIRVCAIGQGDEGTVFAVSEPVRLVPDEAVRVMVTLAAVDEVPAPCGDESSRSSSALGDELGSHELLESESLLRQRRRPSR